MTIRFAKQSLLAICGLLALQQSLTQAQQAWYMQPSPHTAPSQTQPQPGANLAIGTGTPSPANGAPMPPGTLRRMPGTSSVQNPALVPRATMQNVDIQDLQPQDITTQHAQLQRAMAQQAQRQNPQSQHLQPRQNQQSMMGTAPAMPVVNYQPMGGSSAAHALSPQPAAPGPVRAAMTRLKQAFQSTPQSILPQANPYVSQSQVISDRPAMGTPPSASQIANDQVTTWMREASTLEKQGNMEAAMQRYSQAMGVAPNHWQVQLSFARAKHRMGDLDGAVAMYQRILTQYPNHAMALNDLGLLLARQGDIAGSTEQLRRAVALQPRSQRYRNNLATVLIEGNQLNEAVSHLQEVHGEALGEFNMGYLLAQRGQVQLAADHLRVALHLDPSLSPARELLSRIDAPSEQIATRPTTLDGAESAIILRQSAELESDPRPTADAAVYHSATDTDNQIAPLPSEFEIPGIQK